VSNNPTVTSTSLVENELWGIEIKYSDEHRTAYCVGTRAEAGAELIRLQADATYALKARAP
jgi:hypothetical protein